MEGNDRRLDPNKIRTDVEMALFKKLEAVVVIEDRIRECLEAMREFLRNDIGSGMKLFWSLKKYCLPLFKDITSVSIRSRLWKDYVDLSIEGRRLKSIIDEETAFVCEQIELAISSLEENVRVFFSGEKNDAELRENPLIEILEKINVSEENKSFYREVQLKLFHLNIFVSRLAHLRKELVKTEMRIKLKNRFFQRLSAMGNEVFPLRRDYIISLSDCFEQDVQKFVKDNFKENFSTAKIKKNLFFLKEEIKLLQNLSKELTLGTDCFSSTRLSLSGCWDELREFEKTLRAERFEDKQVSSDNVELVIAKLEAFQRSFLEEGLPLDQARLQLNGISKWMRKLDLVYADVKFLKERMKSFYDILEEKERVEEDSRKEREKVKEAEYKEKCSEIQDLLKSLEDMLVDQVDYAKIGEEIAVVRRKIAGTSGISKSEKAKWENALNTVKNTVLEKQEEALLNLSEEDGNALIQIREVLSLKKQRRKEIKERLDDYKKLTGHSGLDFEKALYYDGLVSEEKSKLDVVDADILKLEQCIFSLRTQVV